MPAPLAVPIALSLASSIPNWYQSWQQNKRANQLQSELVRPDFEIPESQKQALNSARVQAGQTRLPGQDAIEGRLDQVTANQVDLIERTGVGGATSINAAGQAYGQQMGKENELGIAAAQNYNQNQQQYRNQLEKMSDWEYQKWNWDKKLPYENKAMAIAALREGSIRNFDTAFKDTLGGASNIALSEYYRTSQNDWLSKLLGDKGAGSANLLSQEQTPTLNTQGYTPSLTSDVELNTTRPVMNKFMYGNF